MGLKVLHNGYLVDSDLLELDRQARLGDAVSGWRGDESMFVAVVDTEAGRVVQVRGRDAKGVEYVAASLPASTPGWRHKLLDKLVWGDWQHRAGDPFQRMIDERKARDAEADRQWRDRVQNELAPKLHWALVKDGLIPRQDFYMTPRKRDVA